MLDRHSGASTTSEKCFGAPGIPGDFQKSCKNIYKPERHFGASGTPGVFYKSYKNIYKLDRHSGASKTSEKCLGTPGTPEVFSAQNLQVYSSNLATHL